MKKIILSIFCCLTILLSTTGCGGDKQKLVDEKSVFSYLQKNYPDEKFEIVDNQQLDDVSDSACGEGAKSGNAWIIKSTDTNIEFTIKDRYRFNSFTCSYEISDDYLQKARDSFLQEINDYRVKSYYSGYYTIGLSIEREDFKTSDEMINFVYDIVDKLNKTYPFKYDKYSELVYLSIDNQNDVNQPYKLSELSSIEKISEIVNKL